MGIKERIAELWAKEATDRLARKLVEDELKKQKTERYIRELDPMILEQRNLFNQLEELGVIAMLEEMTQPSKITPIETNQERSSYNPVKLEKPAKAKVVTLPTEEVKERIAEYTGQKWHGRMLRPEQLEDGSPDPVLRVELLNYEGFPLRGRERKRIVSVSYSQNKTLTVSGELTTFSGVVSKENVNLNTLEDAFAKAFHKPFIAPLPNYSNMISSNFPIGEDAPAS